MRGMPDQHSARPDQPSQDDEAGTLRVPTPAGPDAPHVPGADGTTPKPGDTAAGPGGDSVLFSAAPPPAPEEPETASTGAPGRTGWPWFLPQGGLRREVLESAVDADEDPVAAAAAYARIPLVHRAVSLLEHVGRGRPVTATGALLLADVAALVQAWDLDLGGEPVTSMEQVGALLGPWTALLAGDWLTLDGTRVEPGEGPTPAVARTEDPVAFVRFARALVTLLILATLRQEPEAGGLLGGSDTFTALTHTVGPEGLRIPADLHVALDRGLVPTDPAGDPDMDEINRYWQTGRDLAALAAYGLLHAETSSDGQDSLFHGTVEVLVEAFGALEMLEELGRPG